MVKVHWVQSALTYTALRTRQFTVADVHVEAYSVTSYQLRLECRPAPTGVC